MLVARIVTTIYTCMSFFSAGQQNTEGCRLKGNTSIPAYDADWLVPQSTEDWDTDSTIREEEILHLCLHTFTPPTHTHTHTHIHTHADVLVLPPQVRDTLYSAPSTGNPRDVTNQYVFGVASGLLVKALDCGLKGLGFQWHLQQRFISILGALSPTPKNE